MRSLRTPLNVHVGKPSRRLQDRDLPRDNLFDERTQSESHRDGFKIATALARVNPTNALSRKAIATDSRSRPHRSDGPRRLSRVGKPSRRLQETASRRLEDRDQKYRRARSSVRASKRLRDALKIATFVTAMPSRRLEDRDRSTKSRDAGRLRGRNAIATASRSRPEPARCEPVRPVVGKLSRRLQDRDEPLKEGDQDPMSSRKSIATASRSRPDAGRRTENMESGSESHRDGFNQDRDALMNSSLGRSGCQVGKPSRRLQDRDRTYSTSTATAASGVGKPSRRLQDRDAVNVREGFTESESHRDGFKIATGGSVLDAVTGIVSESHRDGFKIATTTPRSRVAQISSSESHRDGFKIATARMRVGAVPASGVGKPSRRLQDRDRCRSSARRGRRRPSESHRDSFEDRDGYSRSLAPYLAVGMPSRRLQDRDRNVEQLHAPCDVSECHRDGLNSATSRRASDGETMGKSTSKRYRDT